MQQPLEAFDSFNNMNLGATPFVPPPAPQQKQADSGYDSACVGEEDDDNFEDAAIGHVLEDQTDEEE
jgi:hypothetical protein